MSNSVYQINKGINKPIEFKGLKAQYIWWLAGGLVCLFILFVILYLVGVNGLVALGIVGMLGSCLFVYVYRLSNQYGEHGLMKRFARSRLPKRVKCYSPDLFIKLRR